MAWIGTLLNALIAIPKICGYVETAVTEIVTWYVGRQKRETLSAIADAAAFAAHAQTEEERYAASEKWQKALSRPRNV